MLAPSEEVTKTWVKRKGILIKSRPEPTRFSFAVCLAIVFSIAFGFLGGFITAGFALNDNYGSVYESLLAELENTRRCIEREKEKLITMNKMMEDSPIKRPTVGHASATIVQAQNKQIQVQAALSRFVYTLDLWQKNDIAGGCKELKNIINPYKHNGEWRINTQNLFDKNCK